MLHSLVVGLGNPGVEYDATRHNVGFSVVNSFAVGHGLHWSRDKRHRAETAKFPQNGGSVVLAKPTTFMNESGTAVAKLCGFYKIPPQRVIVVYDDIAFEVGDFKINDRAGTGGHNGVADVLEKIGAGFARYRIGVGGKIHRQMDLKDHVLSKFSVEELQILEKKMPEILNYLQVLLDKGAECAMNLANRKKCI
ncbi:MAG: aminoacyl-tRNA hydrolase [Puniceicoccales bacterium]|jgi:PTH1 family peptidyl-tRNA hydrolase|nr:aminoacyl-tRNA hydrolase [Puniceicoccales bacterium]